MKIKSTKNIFKEIKGTNTFEVEMVGKSKDLEKLHRLTSSDVDFQYHYILDMNNIEIIIERDKEGKTTSKAIINLIENEETGQLISWKETHSDGLDLQTQGIEIGNILKGIIEKIRIYGVEDKLKQLDIDIRNIDGEFKKLEEILLEVAEFSDTDMMKFCKTIAGEYNANHLFAFLNNYKNQSKSEVGMKMINSKYIDIDKCINQIEKGINGVDSGKLLKLAADMFEKSTKEIMSLGAELKKANVYLKTLEDLIEIERTHQDEVYRKMYEISMVNNKN